VVEPVANQVIWTKDKIKELRREYTGSTEKDGKSSLNRQTAKLSYPTRMSPLYSKKSSRPSRPVSVISDGTVS
jgi:hypothetical protein